MQVLYHEQGFSDSFVDETFLQSLVINADIHERSYWQLAADTTFLTQQLATVAASVAVAVLLHQAHHYQIPLHVLHTSI